jgi:methylmalonyl-CoA mutase
MNAIWTRGAPAARVYFRSLATRTASDRQPGIDDIVAAAKAAGCRPRRRGDPGHRPGRRRHRGPRRRAALRDDAGVRRRQPAREDRHARLRRRGGHQQVRPSRVVPTPCATSAGKLVQRNREAFGASPRTCPSSAPWHPASTTTASPRSTSACATCSPTTASLGRPVTGALCPPVARRPRPTPTPIVPAGRVRYLAEVADTVRAHHRRAVSRPRWRASCSSPGRETAGAGGCTEEDPTAARREERPGSSSRASTASTPNAGSCSPTGRPPWPPTPATPTWSRCATRRCAPPDARPRCRAPRCRRVALPAYHDHGDLLQVPAGWRTCPAPSPSPPACSRSSAPTSDPARMFAGEGDAFRTNRRFHLLSEGSPPPGCPPPSIRSPSTASTPTSGPTSTARSATPACPSPPSTT